MTTIEDQLKAWGDEYKVDSSRMRFNGYLLGGTLMGSAGGFSDGHVEIALHRKLEGHPFASRIVLWHEFCHGWTWIDLHRMGHGIEFIKRSLKKPFNWILGIVPMLIILF